MHEATPTEPDLLGPMQGLRSADELEQLAPREVSPEQMPQPQRRLLVHRNDMTPTLEAFARQIVELQPLDASCVDDVMHRQVLLIGRRDRRILEYGAIRIFLDTLPGIARSLVEGCKVPLGTILNDYHIAHLCRPRRYLALQADRNLASSLHSEIGRTLFGRRNVIVDPAGRTIADVLEVLPANLTPPSETAS